MILALERHTWRNGTPTTIICDDGSFFTGMTSHGIKKFIGMNIRCTSAFNPQANGTAERANRFLKDCLAVLGVHFNLKKPETE